MMTTQFIYHEISRNLYDLHQKSSDPIVKLKLFESLEQEIFSVYSKENIVQTTENNLYYVFSYGQSSLPDDYEIIKV